MLIALLTLFCYNLNNVLQLCKSYQTTQVYIFQQCFNEWKRIINYDVDLIKMSDMCLA